MSRLECPGENTIVAFAEGILGVDDMARVEAHASSCSLCQALLGVAMATGVRRRAVAGTAAGTETETAASFSPVADAFARGTPFGRYTILSLIGRGGMGDVYAAYDPELDRKVALKLLRADGDTTRGHARLLREAKAMAKVAHPNVVSVHDAGVVGPRVFVAMDFVDGSTMRDWLAERLRTRHEILAVFVEAAHGLMAAHAAGLVHRDFKPSNVMIARDGGVRVTDFGLARTLADADAADARDALPAGDADLGATLTATDRLLGTPRYMAPEQFKAETTDARTDQFGFCVALYEALYGVQPFGGGDLPSLTAAVLAGRIQPAPPKNTVPAWLRRVVLRGLSVAPADRWPSMHELVAALAQDPARARRRWTLACGVSLLAALPVILLVRQPGRSASLCRGGPARLAGVWEALGPGPHAHSPRAAIERAFLASGAPDAKDVWTRVAALLDRYATDWLAMYEDACVASHVRGAQPAHVLDLRMSCLDDRRTALVALTDVLSAVDREAVAKSIDAANALPGLERCGDVRELQVPIEPPRNEAIRRRVAEFRQRLAKSKALNDTGKHLEAQAIARAVIDEARALGYRPVLAEALGGLAQTYNGSVETPHLAPLAEEALSVSLSVGRNDLAALAALTLANFSYLFGTDDADSGHWVKLTYALLDRAGTKQDRLRSWLLQAEAVIRLRKGDLNGALEFARRATALKETLLPKLHPDIAISRNSEADILHALGKNDEALRLNQQVHEVFSVAYGPASAEAAYTLSNRGEYLLEAGRPTEALASYRDALSRWEPHVGPEHQNLGYPLTGIGRALIALARPKEAVPPLERALRLRDPGQTDPELVAEVQFALAQALEGADTGPARAVFLATQARDTYVKITDQPRAAAVDAWLAAQHKPRHAR